MENRHNICSLITIYKPNVIKLKQNIQIISQYSDCVYLLCNSPEFFEIQFDNKIKIIRNNKNIGISRAINKGIDMALNDGYSYAVLFDQDSILTKENFSKLILEMLNESKISKVACIGPSLNVRNNTIPKYSWIINRKRVHSANIISVNNIITSGMLVNIKQFINIEGFHEDFPVDFCDFIFCWKSIYNGYSVIQSKDVYLNHEIGDGSIKIFNRTIHFHAPYRNYFLVRDTLNICFRIKETPLLIRFRYFFSLPFRMFVFLLLLENKKTRLKMYWWGFKDFFLKKKHFGSIANLLGAE